YNEEELIVGEKCMAPRAVVLLSGGVDSATTLAIAKSEGFEPYALTFRYGQRHEAEIEYAKRVATHLHVARHTIVDIDLRVIGGPSTSPPMSGWRTWRRRPGWKVGSGSLSTRRSSASRRQRSSSADWRSAWIMD